MTLPTPRAVLSLGVALVLLSGCGSSSSSAPSSGTQAPLTSAPLTPAPLTPAPSAADASAPGPTGASTSSPRAPAPVRTAPTRATSATPGRARGPAATRPGPATRPTRSAVASPLRSTLATPAAPVTPRRDAPSTTGGVTRTVPAIPVRTKPPVALGRRAQVSATVALEIASVRAVQAQARLPGEISGPGVAVTVAVVNHSSRAVNVADTVVTLTDSSQAPGGSVSDLRARPRAGRLAAGRTGRGTYLFTVPTSRRSPVTVTVTLTGQSPVVQFVGAVR